jgi:hypothetical protein
MVVRVILVPRIRGAAVEALLKQVTPVAPLVKGEMVVLLLLLEFQPHTQGVEVVAEMLLL